MKKEIEVYLHENWDTSMYPEFSMKPNPKDSEFTVKAKLIIEIPEKSVTITESKMHEVLYDTFHSSLHQGSTYDQMMNSIKQKLFGEKS